MNSDVPPTVVAPHMPGSASSSAIPAPVLNYSPGTNGHHGPPKLKKDYRLSWLGELSCLNFKGKKTGGMLTKLVTRIQHSSTDGLMCIGKGELAELMGVSKRTADRYMLELIAFGCIRLVKKGGSTPKGSIRDANWYALGDAFNGIPPPARLKNRSNPRPVSSATLVQPARPMSAVTADQCHALHPLTNKHTDTHTIGSSPLEEKVWVEYCKENFPDWDQADIQGSYCSALAKGEGLRNWKAFAAKCYLKRRKPPQSRPIDVQASPTAQAPLDDTSGSYQLDRLLNMVTGSCTDHKKPSFHQFKREAERLLIPGHKIQGIFKSLESRRWITKDGEPVKNWKSYLNCVARSQRYSDNA